MKNEETVCDMKKNDFARVKIKKKKEKNWILVKVEGILVNLQAHFHDLLLSIM